MINVHKQKIDPRICEHCGLKPAKRLELIQHQLIAHNVNPPSDVTLFRCSTKNCVFVTQKEDLLMKHKREVHKEFQQKCSYCSKVFNKEFLLHAHLRAVHRHKAKTDGMMEFSEDEEYDPSGGSLKDTHYAGVQEKSTISGNNKIEILSNIEIPAGQGINIVESAVITSSSEAEALSNVASGIATSIALVDNVVMDDQYNIEKQLAQMHNEYEEPKKQESNEIITRLVAEDGTEMVLTPEQKEEILQQLQQQGANLSDNVVMVLDQRQLSVDDPNNGIVVMLNDAANGTDLAETPLDNSNAAIKPEEIENAEVVFQDGSVKTKEEDEEEESLKIRPKLIADLEDDWSEEVATEELKPAQSLPALEESKEAKTQDKIENDSSENKKNESSEELSNILQDWESDAKKSAEEPEQEEDELKKEEEAEDHSMAEELKNTSAAEENLNEAENEPVKNDENKNSASSEKSKIITELLDEWNDL